MIVVMKASATEAEIQAVIGMVEKLDYTAHIIRGIERTVVGRASCRERVLLGV